MDDIYSTLIGAAPTATQKQSAIAEQLRRRRSFGELGALTGDRVLQPFGQKLGAEADQYAQDIQDTRQKDTDNTQTEAFQTGQLKHMKDSLAETHRANTFDHIYQMLMAQAALTKADKAGAQKIPRLRQGDITKLQDMSQDIATFNELEDHLKKGKSFGAVEVGGVPIPGARALANTAAALGFGTDDSKEAFRMKQQFDRMYTLGARNRLFGATLTDNEQRAWADANPDTRQSDAQIKEALPILRKVFERRLRNMVGGLTRENYDAGAISEYADLESLGIDAGGAPGGHGAVAQPKRVKVDMDGNVLGN